MKHGSVAIYVVECVCVSEGSVRVVEFFVNRPLFTAYRTASSVDLSGPQQFYDFL